MRKTARHNVQLWFLIAVISSVDSVSAVHLRFIVYLCEEV